MATAGPLNIVVPMAGRGQRFVDAGYRVPKPLIPVHGVPMIRLVIANLMPRRPHRFIFICQREHLAGQPSVTWATYMASRRARPSSDSTG